MAEAIAIIGVVAAAVQFTETGSKVVSRLISLVSRIRDSPDSLHLALDQLQMLLDLAELTKKRIAEENGVCMQAEIPNLRDDQALPRRLSQTSPLTWLEKVWHSCTAQARELDDLILQMLQELEGNAFRKKWRKLCTLKNEESIERILTRIERDKTLLITWYGQENIERLKKLSLNVVSLHEEVFDMRQNMAYLNETMQKLLPANTLGSHEMPQKPMRNTHPRNILSVIEPVMDMSREQDQQTSQIQQQNQSLVSHKKNHSPLPKQTREDSSGEAQEIATMQHMSHSNDHTSPTYQASMTQKEMPTTLGTEEVRRYVTQNPLAQYQGISRLSRCQCRSISRLWVFGLGRSSTLMGKYCSYISDNCLIHRKRYRGSETTMQFRRKLPYMLRVMEGVLKICWSSTNPSLGVSLRAVRRVEEHPLWSFFADFNQFVRAIPINSDTIKRQDYLLGVAQKVLLNCFDSGRASPDDVDSYGCTLLYVRFFPPFTIKASGC